MAKPNHRCALVVFVFLLCVHMAGCERNEPAMGSGQESTASTPLKGIRRLTRSTSVAPLLAEIGKRFQLANPQVTITLDTGGSGRGVSEVADGKADIGMASRVLNDNEKELFDFPLARDGVALLVQQQNPVIGLSEREIIGIFSGTVRNWKDVGGRNAPITLIKREQQRGLIEIFRQRFKLKYENIRAQQIAGDNAEAMTALRNDPCAITPMSFAVSQAAIAAGAPFKILAVDGIAPTRQPVLTGNYPLTRPLTLVTKEFPSDLIQRFIEFSLCSQTTDIIRKMGFIPYQK